MVSTHLIFYVCLELQFLDVESNPGPRRPAHDACRILCSNVRGISRNLSDLAVALSQYDLFLCSKTLVPKASISSCWFQDLVVQFCCNEMGCLNRAHGMAVYVRDGYMVHFANPNCLWYLGCVELDRTSMRSVCFTTLT